MKNKKLSLDEIKDDKKIEKKNTVTSSFKFSSRDLRMTLTRTFSFSRFK